MEILEDKMPFHGYETWYRIIGDLRSGQTPLVCCHGGPGSTHNYFELLDELAKDGRPIISYDQLGCGNSYVEGHPELWTADTWIEELIALRNHLHLDKIHLLGQSWGGMLAIAYLCERHPEGIASVILSSTLSSSALWASEQHRMIRLMSTEDQIAIAKAEETGNYTDPAYLLANEHYMEAHCSSTPTESDPECLRRKKKTGRESYLTAWGPNEYTPTGTLKEFNYTEALASLTVPALILSGTDDLCTPLVAKTMYDQIPNSKWVLFPNARHMCFYDAQGAYIPVLNEWLSQH